jgi:beta-glucanase (GH16 family)
MIMNTKQNISRLLILFMFAGIMVACERDDKQQIEERNWELSWSDEFDGNQGELPDTNYWNFDIGNGDNGWGNAELQSYTQDTANIQMDGKGNLLITALNNGSSYSSARINTKNKFHQKYGRIEASIKLPYGPGIWPAFWMLGSNIDSVSWPQCGEIDIMEYRGQEPHLIHGSIHGPGYSGGNPVTKVYGISEGRFDTDFHLFAVEWDEEKIDFFVDDYLYQRILNTDVSGDWVYDQDFFILLNVAVGGNYVGFPTSETPFPQSMMVDYVRVYTEIK